MGCLLEFKNPDEIKDFFDSIFNCLFINSDDSILNTNCNDYASVTALFKSFEGQLYPRIDEFTFKVRICSLDGVVNRPLKLDITSKFCDLKGSGTEVLKRKLFEDALNKKVDKKGAEIE